MSEKRNAGIVTAYGAARHAGYQGSYSDFCALMAALPIQIDQLENMTVIVTMLDPGSAPSASYVDGTLTLNIPIGNTGPKGDTGYPTDAQVQNAVSDWLSENVDPETGYVLDRTLTQPNAAAPADLVGAQSEKIDGLAFYDTIENVGVASFNSKNAIPIEKTVIEIDSESESVTGCTIYQTGANLLNPNEVVKRSGYSKPDVSVNGDTISVTDYTSSARFIAFVIPVVVGETYTIKAESISSKGNGEVFFSDTKPTAWANGSAGSIDYTNKITVTATAPWMGIGINKQADYTITKFMVNVGSDALPWEPYQGTIYPISWESEAGAITSGEVTVNKDGSTKLVTGGSTYNITGINPITAYVGANNIWSSVGNIKSLKYIADSKTYIDTKDSLIKALFAPVLNSMVADTALSANAFRLVGDTLYKITSPIASGGTLTPNTNCVATTIGAEITAILNS